MIIDLCTGELKFSQFCTFMNNLQAEVLHMEFGEFSKGSATISELDFARILLRYTFLNSEDYDNILERLVERLQEEQGITFEEFKDFCQFLNNLDDFQIAMRMYTLADKPISQVQTLGKILSLSLSSGGVFSSSSHLHRQASQPSHGGHGLPDLRRGWRRSSQLSGVRGHDEGQDSQGPQVLQQTGGLGGIQTMHQERDEGVNLRI